MRRRYYDDAGDVALGTLILLGIGAWLGYKEFKRRVDGTPEEQLQAQAIPGFWGSHVEIVACPNCQAVNERLQGVKTQCSNCQTSLYPQIEQPKPKPHKKPLPPEPPSVGLTVGRVIIGIIVLVLLFFVGRSLWFTVIDWSNGQPEVEEPARLVTAGLSARRVEVFTDAAEYEITVAPSGVLPCDIDAGTTSLNDIPSDEVVTFTIIVSKGERREIVATCGNIIERKAVGLWQPGDPMPDPEKDSRLIRNCDGSPNKEFNWGEYLVRCSVMFPDDSSSSNENQKLMNVSGAVSAQVVPGILTAERNGSNEGVPMYEITVIPLDDTSCDVDAGTTSLQNVSFADPVKFNITVPEGSRQEIVADCGGYSVMTAVGFWVSGDPLPDPEGSDADKWIIRTCESRPEGTWHWGQYFVECSKMFGGDSSN